MDKFSAQGNIFPKKAGAGIPGFFLVALFLIFLLLKPQQGLWAEPVTFQEQLNQDISALFRPSSPRQLLGKSSPSSYQPMVKCATPLLRQALQHRELLYPENRFVLHRPTGLSGPEYYGYGIEVWSYNTSEGHFRIYYTEDNSYGDAVSNTDGLVDGLKSTIPDYVLRFAQYFEQAWSHITGALGYRAPIEDGDRIEVFILNMSCYGSTVADGRGLYIMVDNNYQGINDNLDQEGNVIGAMKITAVHEFFHVVQADYDHWPTSSADTMWWEENTAVWVEDELYDDIDDYLNYLGWSYEDHNDNGKWDSGEPYLDIRGNPGSIDRKKGWFDYPSISLNKTGNDSPFYAFEYGGVIWAKFLSEHFGQEIVRTIFEQIQDPSRNIFLAMDESIKDSAQEPGRSMDSLSEAFIRFKLANLRRHLEDYEEGSKYPVPLHQESYSTYPVHIAAGSLVYLSSRYYAFQKPPSGQVLHIHFDGGTQSPVAVLAVPATSYRDSSPQFGIHQLIPLDNERREGDFDFSFNQNPAYTKLVIIPINLSLTETAYYTLDVGTTDETQSPPVPLGLHYSTMSRDGHPVVLLAWNDIQDISQYQVWRGMEEGLQTLIFHSDEGGQPYQDCNSFEDSDPALEFQKDYLYQVRVINSSGSSSSETIPVRIPEEYPQNHPPQFEPVDDKGISEGELLKFTLTATDPDGDNLTYSTANLPAGAAFNLETREFSWRPGSDQTGNHEVTFIATDDADTPLSSSITVTIMVHGKSSSFIDVDSLVNQVDCFITSCRYPD